MIVTRTNLIDISHLGNQILFAKIQSSTRTLVHELHCCCCSTNVCNIHGVFTALLLFMGNYAHYFMELILFLTIASSQGSNPAFSFWTKE
jgi:hypothetical protein